MPISTISPQNNSQQALLAQSLSGTGAVLLSALNSAIQRSRDDANIRFNQEQNFINEQQRNIQNDRVERFNNQKIANDIIARGDAAPALENRNATNALNLGALEDTITFDREQRDILSSNNATNADNQVLNTNERQRAINEGVTPVDAAIRDRERQEDQEARGLDPTSQLERRNKIEDEEIARRRQAEEQQKVLKEQAAGVTVENASDDPAELAGQIQILKNSGTPRDKQVAAALGEKLKQAREAQKNTLTDEEKLENAREFHTNLINNNELKITNTSGTKTFTFEETLAELNENGEAAFLSNTKTKGGEQTNDAGGKRKFIAEVKRLGLFNPKKESKSNPESKPDVPSIIKTLTNIGKSAR